VGCASRFHHQQNLFWQRAWLFGIALALCALMGAQEIFLLVETALVFGSAWQE
jgi:hypothetical protein